MTDRPDSDLLFLAESESDDLEVLVDLLCGKPGDLRVAQTFAGTAKYERYYPDRLQRCTQEIATELQTFGGNTFANTLRSGQGVPHGEILGDVCGEVGAKPNPTDRCKYRCTANTAMLPPVRPITQTTIVDSCRWRSRSF
jgi:hypothetical protein